MSKILDINTSLQVRNRIFKDSANLVSQVTDAVQGIPFVGVVGYEYNNGADIRACLAFHNPVHSYLEECGSHINFIDLDEFVIDTTVAGPSPIFAGLFGKWVAGGSSGCELLCSHDEFRISKNGSAASRNIISFTVSTTSGAQRTLFMFKKYVTTFVMLIVACYSDYPDTYVVKAKGEFPISELPPTTDTPILIGKTSDNKNYLGRRVYNVSVFDKLPFDLASLTVGDDVSSYYKPFTFLPFAYPKRYKEDGFKKLFISSRYLKDAVINSDDKVEELSTEIRGVNSTLYGGELFVSKMRQTDVAKQPEITKNGIKFTKANGTWLETNNDTFTPAQGYYKSFSYLKDITSITFMFWHMPLSADVGQGVVTFGTLDATKLAVRWQQSTVNGKYTFYDGALHEANKSLQVDTYNHIAVVMDVTNSKFYCFINGVLEIDSSKTWSLNDTYYRMLIGTYLVSSLPSDCLIDDFLISHNDSIINPTGYAVGDKVFDPPRRRSLETGEYQGRELVKASTGYTLFVNSRYLTDSVIDSSGNIESLKLENRGQYGNILEQTTAAYQPTITKDGFYFNSNGSGLLSADGTEHNTPVTIFDWVNSQNTFIGYWVKHDSIGDSYAHFILYPTAGGGILRCRIENSTHLLQADWNGNKITSLNVVTQDTFMYITHIKHNDIIYLLINGVLQATAVDTYSVATEVAVLLGNQSLNSGYYTHGFIDDFLISHNDSIIDPTGYSIGDKVFTPPRRSSSQLQIVK